ncbi:MULTISPECIES: helix-turn-helix domain-containing protein [unclassified Actinomyces]|uniref:helix-turn-helix transcriptional regulator n=1 Tax=unclassified Actinomyces TaxID=2609248 RepID=UPI00137440EF|nr:MULTISPECIES: helix-turn-helix domain-containing protein [unclassified Actinomyces]MBW3069884.1 MarR family transcriptional regulator [Actinomyces sp. 594]NDR53853.1 MarR family transcriptional regulator [Actinomyces sp. 565]QHO90686.1 transcriptional regulator [Actinomyces sp. 432]
MSVPSVPAAPLPRPAWADLSVRAELSQARRRVLEEIEHASHPLTAAHVARTLNLHHNTVREHLDALVEAGLVNASTNPTGRRGRPALQYAPAGPDPARVAGSYLALLDAVIDQLGDGEQARERAKAIGRRWAQLTPADPASPVPQAGRPETQLTALAQHLSLMGFAPDFDGEQLVLKACPLVTSSRPPHPLVCVMHESFLNERYARCRAGAESEAAPRAKGAAAHLTLSPLRPDGCHVSFAAHGGPSCGHTGDHTLKR